MTRKRTHKDKLRGSVKHYLRPLDPVAPEEWDSVDTDGYFVPKSRLRREWRKWVRVAKSGGVVYSTRCGKEPVRILVLSNRDFDRFTEALNRPPRPLPDAIRRAKINYDTLVDRDVAELLADGPVGREFGGPDCEYD